MLPSDTAKLAGVHPDLEEKVMRVLRAMEALGHPMKVVQGVRTDAYQAGLYAQGRTAPGKIVTNADGILKKSNHQIKDDGFGYAVDCAFVDDPRTPADETWDEKLWNRAGPVYGAMGRLLGLSWGGDWKSIVDRPHLELRKAPVA